MGPRIGITCWRRRLATPADPSTDLFTLGVEYVESLRAAGAVPLLLPHLDEPEVARVLDVLDGVLLSGGGDVEPAVYGAVDAGGNSGIDVAADRSELALARAARDRGTPVLAVCRGMQILNVAFGGTLCQDCTSDVHAPVATDPEGVRRASHPVMLEPDSRLARIAGGTSRVVNTIHHQAVERVADGFRVTARAPDGVVEGIESTTGWDALGVQWHPERTAGADDRLFAAFLDDVTRSALARSA